MAALDEDALVCDMAETYGVFDLRGLPVRLLATLAAGLRDTSRIKMKSAGMHTTPDTLLLAMAVDRLTFLSWAQTKDGQKGINRPASVTEILLGREDDGECESYETAEEFEAARKRILMGV